MRLTTLGPNAFGLDNTLDDDLSPLNSPVITPTPNPPISGPGIGISLGGTPAGFSSAASMASPAAMSSAAAPSVTVSSTIVGSSVHALVASSTGFSLNLIFDAGTPTSFQSSIQQAASILASTLYDKITVNLNIHYSGSGGGASANGDGNVIEPLSTVTNALKANASPGDTVFNGLPTGSSVQGQSSVMVWNAEAKALGLINPNDTTTVDGHATFSTDIDPSAIVGVALHELTHAMGRVPELYGSPPDIFELFRFTQAGDRLFEPYFPGFSAPAAYFSLDGGNTKIADYGEDSDPSDFLNTGVQGPNDPFNEFYDPGSTLQSLTAVDKTQLDVLGFHPSPPKPTDTTPPSLVVDGPLLVDAINTGAITSSVLRFDDNTSSHAQETYTIVTAPAHGYILKSGVQVLQFTQADIDNGLIVYQEVTYGVSSDSFTFRVSDALGNTTSTQTLQIQVVDTRPPLLFDNAKLTVPSGGSAVITESYLRYDDNSSSHAQEVYTVLSGPTHGTLLKSGHATAAFTQADIDNGLISYAENGTSLAPDSFTFVVADAAGNATIAQTFQIQFTDQSPPSPVVDIPLTVTINGSNVITSNLLRFDDTSSSHAQETYTVLTAPTHGGLLKSGPGHHVVHAGRHRQRPHLLSGDGRRRFIGLLHVQGCRRQRQHNGYADVSNPGGRHPRGFRIDRPRSGRQRLFPR